MDKIEARECLEEAKEYVEKAIEIINDSERYELELDPQDVLEQIWLATDDLKFAKENLK